MSDDVNLRGSDHGNGGLERWRGSITEQVRNNSGAIRSLDEDVSVLRQGLDGVRIDLTKVKVGLTEARNDIAVAARSFADMRESEWVALREALREALAEHVTTRRDIYRYISAPIGVALLVGLLLYALTGFR